MSAAATDAGRPRETVAIVGPGRVGTAIALACVRAGLRVVAAGGGGEAARARFAARVAGAVTDADPAGAVRGADLVVIAVPDDAITDVVTALAVADALHVGQRLVHVAGSRGLDVLERARLAGARIAACHPAQTVPTPDPDALVGAAWAVTAGAADRDWAHELVIRLGGDPHDVPEDVRVLYHAGLAVASNAAGAAVAVGRALLLAARVARPEAFLEPLVTASVRNALHAGAAALTGPVARGDAGTVSAHLAALDRDAPTLARAYRHLSAALLEQVRPALDPDVAAHLGALLGSALPAAAGTQDSPEQEA